MNNPIGKSTYVPLLGIMTRRNGKKYQAVPAPKWDNDCEACAFGNKPTKFCGPVRCEARIRNDGREVVFIRRKDLEEDPAKKS